VNLVAGSTLSVADLAELFTRAYEGYYVPMRVDEQTMRSMVEWWDIDLDRSRVAVEDGEHVGVANLAVRGDRAWIGGIGVVPSARRHGLGRQLLEAVIAEAPGSVSLEVLVQNEPAIGLYESLGFERTRLLEVWSLKEPPLVEARSTDPAPLGQDGLPWQRADEALPEDYERLEVDGGAMLLRGGNVLQLRAEDEDAAVALLSRGKPLTYVNVPEGDVASAALARLGGELTLRQHEMELAR
jgi:ribosomal protein S18 acetylase RimI-like enzyme